MNKLEKDKRDRIMTLLEGDGFISKEDYELFYKYGVEEETRSIFFFSLIENLVEDLIGEKIEAEMLEHIEKNK